MNDHIPLKVEFSGGLEMLFSNLREHKVTIPALDSEKKPSNVAFLIKYLCDNVMDDPRKEMFVIDESVRPGVLVLINDADWELEGEADYELQPHDNIMFVSTLHGG